MIYNPSLMMCVKHFPVYVLYVHLLLFYLNPGTVVRQELISELKKPARDFNCGSRAKSLKRGLILFHIPQRKSSKLSRFTVERSLLNLIFWNWSELCCKPLYLLQDEKRSKYIVHRIKKK